MGKYHYSASFPSLFMGADPDTVRPSFCVVDRNGVPLWLWCPKIVKHDLSSLTKQAVSVPFPRQDVVCELYNKPVVRYAAIEDQYIVEGDGKADRMRKVCQNAGACIALLPMLSASFIVESAKFIRPCAWTGNFEKHVHQARTLRKLGWGYKKKGGKTPYCIPVSPPKKFAHFKAGEWKHIVDAIGLALYARDIYLKEQRTGAKLWEKM